MEPDRQTDGQMHACTSDRLTCKPHCPVDPEAVLLPARATLTFANLERAVVLQGILGLQALGASVLAEGRHGLLGGAVLQQPVEYHARLLLDAALLGHQAVEGGRRWRATCKRRHQRPCIQPVGAAYVELLDLWPGRPALVLKPGVLKMKIKEQGECNPGSLRCTVATSNEADLIKRTQVYMRERWRAKAQCSAQKLRSVG